MSKKVISIIIVIVFAICGGVFYLLNSPADKSKMEAERVEKIMPSSDRPVVSDKSPNNLPGSYIDYTSTTIADTPGTKLLFFHAPWCPQCRMLETDIKARGVPDGVTIIKVDYDSSQSLRKKYGVTLQTTIVRVDDQGNLIEKFVAYDNPSLATVKENLL
ncbi:MAG: thioredoxin family protein [Candidatus Saccharimonadales bacterium]